jgi:hypothetical protein
MRAIWMNELEPEKNGFTVQLIYTQ